MYIRKLEIENFRQLRNISIDIEEELSLVIGKNNSGKTSILTALTKLLNDKASTISSYDFNLDFVKEIEEKLGRQIKKDEFSEFGIRVKLYIEYTENADLSNIYELILDLDPENNFLVLGFEYLIATYDDFLNFQNKYNSEVEKIDSFNEFFSEYQKDYFKFFRRTYLYDVKKNTVDKHQYVDIDKKDIKLDKVINFKYISAKRNVQNKENDKTLSEQSHKIYRETEKSPSHNQPLDNLRDALKEINTKLDPIYGDIFKDIIQKVGQFGGQNFHESNIKITSAIKQENLLKDNTTVMYLQNNAELPESYNGLGYMNLINMIFELEILLQSFITKFSDINFLIIEEPEAHTHPQMQYIFIKNIKSLLKDRIKGQNGDYRHLQYMITSHSSHIVADSDFDDIKYLKKDSSVVVKNLRALKNDYDLEGKQYQFLKQYLTLHRAELFFADKAILYEGDTERILLPSIMKKFDLELPQGSTELPLCSQNISLIEIGAYAQIYEKFLEFIGIKTLVITDIDSGYRENKLDKDNNLEKNQNGTIKQVEKKCQPLDPKAQFTTNSSLKHFFGESNIKYYLELECSQKSLSKNIYTFSFKSNLKSTLWDSLDTSIRYSISKRWIASDSGWLRIAYQIAEDSYCARSFEDAFIHINRNFIHKYKDDFQGLKNIEKLNIMSDDAYDIADQCIKKKTHFALDIIYFSNADMSNWKIPQYIKEGLIWLQQN